MKNILVIAHKDELGDAYQEILSYFADDKLLFTIINPPNLGNITPKISEYIDNSEKIDVVINCINCINSQYFSKYSNENSPKNSHENSSSNNQNNYLNYIVDLVNFCKNNSAILVHYTNVSEDSFDFINKDEINNNKALTKQNLELEIEEIIKKTICNFIVFRIADIYSINLKYENFYTKIYKIAKEEKEISVPEDEFIYPISAEFIVNNTIRIIKKLYDNDDNFANNINKIFSLNNHSAISKFDFAKQILLFLKRSREIIKLEKINPIKTQQKELNNLINNTPISNLADCNQHNLQRKYLAIFAHYDKDNIIDDYVLFYLKGLKKVADKIFFASDCDLPEIELSKLDNLCDKVIAKKHGEYDFGSYKRGIELAYQEITDFDAIILANDSCYGPLSPLEDIFQQMEFSPCDFWGLTINQEIYLPHLQSYFLVFNKRIINSAEFKDFFRKITREESKKEIIEKYEIGLTTELLKSGFTMDSFVKTIYEKNPAIVEDKFENLIISNNFPLIKVSLVLKSLKLRNYTIESKEEIIKECGILLEKHSKRFAKGKDFGLKKRYLFL